MLVDFLEKDQKNISDQTLRNTPENLPDKPEETNKKLTLTIILIN